MLTSRDKCRFLVFRKDGMRVNIRFREHHVWCA